MNVNGVNGTGAQPNTAGLGSGNGGQMDAVGKDLQNQIQNLQKQLQELSSNREMPAEAKMKKRQELQKQISQLEMQLRQHQMDVKREERQKKQEKGPSMDEMLGAKKQEQKGAKQSAGISAGNMEALISADTSMKQADIHGSTASHMENRAGVLEAEIKQDKGGPGDATAAKEEELAEVNELADKAASSQMDSLNEANKTLQEAASKEEKDDTKTGKDEDGTDKVPGAKKDEDISKSEEESRDGQKADSQKNDTYDVEMPGVAFSRGYQPVDIRL